LGIFRVIYQFSPEMQINLVNKWENGLCHFMVEPCGRWGNADLQGPDLNVYNTAITMVGVLKSLQKLNSQGSLTGSNWEALDMRSQYANIIARLAFTDAGGSGCENLAGGLHGHHRVSFLSV
jgi:hypothetical protein